MIACSQTSLAGGSSPLEDSRGREIKRERPIQYLSERPYNELLLSSTSNPEPSFFFDWLLFLFIYSTQASDLDPS